MSRNLVTGILSNEQQILLEIADGNERSFRLFFDHYSSRINAFAWRLTRSETLAEEVVQEVFTKVWISRKELAQVRSGEAWLVTIAKNTATNMLRRLSHELLIMQELGSTRRHEEVIEETLQWKYYHEQLHKAVEQLPPQQRKVWIMSRRHGIRQRQIADELSISIHTVKEYLKKSASFLKKNVLMLFM